MIGIILMAGFVAALVPLNVSHHRERMRLTPEERALQAREMYEESRIW